MKLILFFIFSFNLYADFTLNNNVSAGFKNDRVKVYFTSNSTCSNINVTSSEMLNIIDDAIHQYWNTVPTSRLKLENGGLLETSNTDYLTGDLCNPDLETCEASTVPKSKDIVISCNTNVTSSNNFKPVSGNPSKKIAVALPNYFSGQNILGSVIIINNTSDGPFKDLDYNSRVATIAHEIGHAFGLGHSNSKSSLMYYKVQEIRHSLGPDDVAGITYLYPIKVDGCGLLTVREKHEDGNNFGPSFLLGLVLILLLNFLTLKFKTRA